MIFICSFDPIGRGKFFYSTSTRLDELPYERLGNGRYTIFINIHGEQKRLRKGVRSLVELFKENRTTDAFTRQILKEIERGKGNEEWKDMYELMMNHDEQVREEGRDEGRILGTVETMLDDGKSDQEIISRLMLKYGLKKEAAEEYVLVPA